MWRDGKISWSQFNWTFWHVMRQRKDCSFKIGKNSFRLSTPLIFEIWVKLFSKKYFSSLSRFNFRKPQKGHFEKLTNSLILRDKTFSRFELFIAAVYFLFAFPRFLSILFICLCLSLSLFLDTYLLFFHTSIYYKDVYWTHIFVAHKYTQKRARAQHTRSRIWSVCSVSSIHKHSIFLFFFALSHSQYTYGIHRHTIERQYNTKTRIS